MKQLLFFFFLILMWRTQAQIKEGVYSTGELPCSSVVETMDVEIIRVRTNYYHVKMRTHQERAKNYIKHYIIEYYGSYENGQLNLSKFDTYNIEDERLIRSKYFPGKRRGLRYDNAFSQSKTLIIVPIGDNAIKFKTGRYSKCESPRLEFNIRKSKSRQKVNEFLDRTLAAAPTKFKARNKKIDNILILHNWSRKFHSEFPEIDPNYSTYAQSIYKSKDYMQESVKNLFTDEYFIPVFGKAFDELMLDDRNEILTAIKNASDRYSQFSYQYLYLIPWQTKAIQTHFAACARYRRGDCFESTSEYVKSYRSVTKAAKEIDNALKNNNVLTLKELLNFRGRFENDLKVLWPSIKSPLVKEIEKQINVAAERDLRKIVNVLINQSPTFDLLFDLEEVDNTDEFKFSSSLVQNRVEKQIETKIGEVILNLMELERKEIQLIHGKASDPIKSFYEWYEDFRRSYQSYMNRKEIRDVLDEVNGLVLINLNKHPEKVEDKIQNSKTEQELNKVQTIYLSLTKNSYTNIQNRLEKMVEERRTKIKYQNDAVIGRYTAFDLRRIELQTTSSGEPTEDQMKVALYKKLYGASDFIKEMADRPLDMDNDPYNSIIGFFLRPVKNVEYVIHNFEKLGCEKSPNMPGYNCACIQKVKVTGIGMNMPSTNQIVTHLFLKSDNYGWTITKTYE